MLRSGSPVEVLMENLQQWQKVKEIVGSAVDRPPAERDPHL
jgi:hypothetical protein